MSDALYLRGRAVQVYDAPNAHRPRWTVSDAHAVMGVIAMHEQLRDALIECRTALILAGITEHPAVAKAGAALAEVIA